MIISRIISVALRAAELISSVIVLGLMAYQVHLFRERGIENIFTRYLYTLVISALSVLAGIVLLIPFRATFQWPVDFTFTALWFAAFGLLVDANVTELCGGVFNWNRVRGIYRNDFCGRERSAQAFSFLAAIFFFATFLLSLWVSRNGSRDTVVTTKRRGWGRRSAV